MPTVFRDGPYAFRFYSADHIEPPHIHVQRDRYGAKFGWQAIGVILRMNCEKLAGLSRPGKDNYWRRGMTTLVLERDPIAVSVEVTAEALAVRLADGRVISTALEWYPRLAHATPAERNQYELLGQGSGIGWPALDEHLSVESILAGRSSGESQESFRRWLASRRSVSGSE